MFSRTKTASIETASASALSKLLNIAIASGHVWPAFQPIVNMRTGAVASFEILARWSDPQAGDISPAIFIPHLERDGLIGTLSDALMDQACRAAAGWPGQFTLAFNISPSQLTSRNLPGRLVDVVGATGFPLDRIEIEVTEGFLISDDDLVLTILREINSLGIRIGIDDFGTGYSSLARLEAFPFHKLKIDARFVRNLDKEAGKRRIAAAVIGLGQSLGITVVAEGIESEAEAVILRELGCEQGQGWLYGRGASSDQARRQLDRRGADIAAKPLDVSPFQRLHQLATLYDQAPAGLCFLDTNYRYVRVNDRFAEFHGHTAEQLEGKTIHDVIHGQPLEHVIRILDEAKSKDVAVTHETILRDRNIMFLNSRVQELAGDIIGISVVAIDVTEETKLKQALTVSEKRLRRELDFVEAILRSLPGIFYYYDHDLRLKRWNANHELVSGFSGAELQDRSPLAFIADEERERISDAMQDVFRQGQSQAEAYLLTKDGKRLPYLFTGVRFDHDGQAGFVGAGTDMSESKRMERALREKAAVLEAVIENSPDGLLLLAPDGNRIVQNRRFNELWKIPPELAAGPYDRPQFDHVMSQVKNRDAVVARVVWLETHPDEVSFETIELLDGTVIQRHTSPLYDGAGRHCGRIWAFHEVTRAGKNAMQRD